MTTTTTTDHIRWLTDLDSDDTDEVGGKNASLGEMIGALADEGIRVPTGFATTATAYRAHLDANDLTDLVAEQTDRLDGDDETLADVGRTIRTAIAEAPLPEDVETAIRDAYRELADRTGRDPLDVAVRSSATAEDLPEASFAGQQETELNVVGADDLVAATRRCMASLFTDRAITYREAQGFDHLDVALSVGVQPMVRSDEAGAGVAFTIDTETGFPDVVVIDAAWGLGESVVGGTVNPDSYLVFKRLLDDEHLVPIIGKELGTKATKVVYSTNGDDPTETVETDPDERLRWVLDDDEILTLARWCVAIERHYERPMDIEWAKDGPSDDLYVVQARPETVQARRTGDVLTTQSLTETPPEPLVEGLAIGSSIAVGPARRLASPDDAGAFNDGDVLVTEMTDPDWGPIMERAAAIVTDHGGRTSHAAIVSRELGIPAIVGCGDASDRLGDGDEVTVSCAEGDTGR
ncbi:MAG: phosphoenolpyruvate synthase, partial [Acidimicrobiia bacterium]